MDRLAYALSILVGDPCIQIGAALHAACRRLRFASADEPPVAETSVCTWLCDEALFFTLVKTDSGTLVYSHANDVLYCAAPCAHLSAACPVNTAILCQFTVDALPPPDDSTPRLLAFDILSASDSAARGEALRSMAQHLPAPLCCVQWVGPRLYLTAQFTAGLPHRTKGGFALTADPLFVVPLSSI